MAADAAFYSGKNEVDAKARGVKRVCIPNRSTKSPERKREQKKRWFRSGQCATLTAPARDGLSNVRAGTEGWAPQGPNKRMERKRRRRMP